MIGYCVPAADTADHCSAMMWVVDQGNVLHALKPDDDDSARRSLVTDWAFCGRQAKLMTDAELYDDLDLCAGCEQRLHGDGYQLDYCGHCGGYVVGWRGVAGVHQVQRVNRQGVYRVRALCPGTWHAFDASPADYPRFEIGHTPDDPADAARRPGAQRNQRVQLHRDRVVQADLASAPVGRFAAWRLR
jgi:hypothetical protein